MVGSTCPRARASRGAWACSTVHNLPTPNSENLISPSPVAVWGACGLRCSSMRRCSAWFRRPFWYDAPGTIDSDCWLDFSWAFSRRLHDWAMWYLLTGGSRPACWQMCLYVTMAAFADLRRVNHRFCPTLLISFAYANGFPRRDCENTDPAATSRSGHIHSDVVVLSAGG